MINEIKPSLLLPTELENLAGKIHEAISSVIKNDQFILTLLNLVKEDINRITEALKKDKISEYTRQVQKMDEKRDHAFIAFRDYVKVCMNRSNEEIVKQAEILVNLIKNHGWNLHNLSYNETSQKLQELIKELKNPENHKTLAQIGGETWFSEMEEAENKFREIYNDKNVSEMGKEFPILRESKSKLSFHLLILVDCIRIKEELEPKETANLVVNLNEMINETMSIARSRKTKNVSTSEETNLSEENS